VSPSRNRGKAPTAAGKIRLDLLLVERGLAESRGRAQAMLLARAVKVGGQVAAKAGALVASDAVVELVGEPLPYVSRGGLKLEGALADFQVFPAGLVCLDAGSSTGGFTDCLLQRGAARVYAVDVNTRQLDWKLRQDMRVVPVEINARLPLRSSIPEDVDLVTVDVSFISVAKVLPSLAALAKSRAVFLVLVKPQFELQRRDIGKGGIVRDPALHAEAVERVRKAAVAAGLEVLDVKPSRLTGAEGNQEFFLHARKSP
jgi:23S rRNA (cytidine1920-2'-O)/16S rRNA (cytidine1409-2'-O)-methyltransferase